MALRRGVWAATGIRHCGNRAVRPVQLASGWATAPRYHTGDFRLPICRELAGREANPGHDGDQPRRGCGPRRRPMGDEPHVPAVPPGLHPTPPCLSGPSPGATAPRGLDGLSGHLFRPPAAAAGRSAPDRRRVVMMMIMIMIKSVPPRCRCSPVRGALALPRRKERLPCCLSRIATPACAGPGSLSVPAALAAFNIAGHTRRRLLRFRH